MSLPSRERGLKLHVLLHVGDGRRVAPFTGAWIEILTSGGNAQSPVVAPFTGAWIEICAAASACPKGPVAPFTGAWIEIDLASGGGRQDAGRSLHGSVD